jgi:hypothetical protein
LNFLLQNLRRSRLADNTLIMGSLGEPVLGITPLIGYRGWRVPIEEDNLYDLRRLELRSMHRPVSWPAREPVHAECIMMNMSRYAQLGPKHAAPHLGCWCGVYAVKADVQHLRRHVVQSVQSSLWWQVAFGVVALWGRVVEHDDGYRAERAMPIALWDEPQAAAKSLVLRRLAAMYDVPLLEWGTTPSEIEMV